MGWCRCDGVVVIPTPWPQSGWQCLLTAPAPRSPVAPCLLAAQLCSELFSHAAHSTNSGPGCCHLTSDGLIVIITLGPPEVWHSSIRYLVHYDGSVTRNENETYKKLDFKLDISQVYEFYLCRVHENILLLAFTTANVPLISQFWSRYPDHGRLHNEPQLNDNSLIQKCFQSRGQSPERGDKIFRFPAPPLWLVTRGEVSGLSTQCPQCRQCDQRGSMETSHRWWRGPSHADTSRHNITLQQTCRPCLTMLYNNVWRRHLCTFTPRNHLCNSLLKVLQYFKHRQASVTCLHCTLLADELRCVEDRTGLAWRIYVLLMLLCYSPLSVLVDSSFETFSYLLVLEFTQISIKKYSLKILRWLKNSSDLLEFNFVSSRIFLVQLHPLIPLRSSKQHSAAQCRRALKVLC